MTNMKKHTWVCDNTEQQEQWRKCWSVVGEYKVESVEIATQQAATSAL